MVKRLFWVGVGAAAGASGTVWVQQKVKRQMETLGPDSVVQVAGTVASKAGSSALKVGRRVTYRLVDAASEGRSTMREREGALKEARDTRAAGPRRMPARPDAGAPADSLSSIRAARR